MSGILDGKTVFVTGGGGGIGRATSLVMAREGARLAVSDCDLPLAEETAAEVRAAGGTAMALAGDVADDTQVKAMIDAVVAQYGRLDCAFNNAGTNHAYLGVVGKRTHEIPLDAANKVIAVNLMGVFHCMKYQLIQMLAQGGGAICNTASAAGLVGLQMSSSYVASKHGVVGLTRTAALEYAAEGIRVNCVCPGFTDTRMIRDVMSRRGNEVMQMVPNRRIAQPSEVGELVAWLCSERASYVTGAAYAVDGGYTAA
jgi:NAD(P)-dependent dehydrogenase (short-subunit alcohol dehydrogenase family)